MNRKKKINYLWLCTLIIIFLFACNRTKTNHKTSETEKNVISIRDAKLTKADKIIQKHIEKTGGEKAWKTIKSIMITKRLNTLSGYLVKFTSKKNYLYRIKKSTGGVITHAAFDGKTAWHTNRRTNDSEKMDNTGCKRIVKEFPSIYLTYKKLGYKVELLGEQNINEMNCYKLRIIKGETVDDTLTSFISKKNYMLIAEEKKIYDNSVFNGKIDQRIYSDFREVNGIILPYKITQHTQDQVHLISSYKINAEVDQANFKFLPPLSSSNIIDKNSFFKEIIGKTPDGKEIKLSKVVAKNKYTLLEFWASS